MIARSLAALCLLLPFSLRAQPDASSSPSTTAGKLVIAGGAVTTSRAEVWKVLLTECLPGRPIGIISTASEKPAKSGVPLAEFLNLEHGPDTALFIPLDSRLGNAADVKILELINRCGGFFFTGGSQTLTTKALLNEAGAPTPALAAIWKIHRAGGVIGGSSAGAAIMSDPMISGGESANALIHGATPVSTPSSKQGVLYCQGIGFSPGILYCQHHLERGRFGRLLAALVSAEVGLQTGFGISEDTALVVHHAADTATVIGARDLVYVDAKNGRRTADGGVTGVRVHYLSPGDRIRLSTGEVDPAPGKISLAPGPDDEPVEVADAWARDAFRHLFVQLAQGAVTTRAVAQDGRFKFVLARSANTRAWGLPHQSGSDGHGLWTLTDMTLVVEPLQSAASGQ